jgi:hypothetical protein
MFNGTEVVFARANLNSKWNKNTGGLKYVNSQSIDNFMFEIEKKELEQDLNKSELELKMDIKNIEEINETFIKSGFNRDYGYLPNRIDIFYNNSLDFYKNYNLDDFYNQNKNLETNIKYNFTDYKLDTNLIQKINISRYFDTITKIWFHFEKPSEITGEDLYLISQTVVIFEIGKYVLINKPFSMCIIENLLQEYELDPKDNILKICLIDFENLCEFGLPQISLQAEIISLKFQFASKSIEKYSKYISYVVEGYYLLNNLRRELWQKQQKFTIITSEFLTKYKLENNFEYYLTYFHDLVNTVVWITICFNVNSELLQINKVGLSAENNEYLYWESDDLVIISFNNLTFCNIILDPEYKNKDKFVKLIKNKFKPNDIRGVNFSSISKIKLKIDCNVNTRQNIFLNIYTYGFDEYQIAGGIICKS